MYGELKLGAQPLDIHVLGIFIGTGIGGAIVVNGKLHLALPDVWGISVITCCRSYGRLGVSERHGILDEVANRKVIAGATSVRKSRHRCC
jgi:glucokinase